MRQYHRCVAVALVLALSAAFGIGAAQKGDPESPYEKAERQRKVLAPAMAKKLGHAHQIMTSLALEDFSRMSIDAAELKKIGEATLMKISPSQEYIKFAAEFSAIAEELGRRARAHDLNGATLSYIRLTMNCVECHKYVRDKSVLGRNP